ncbi:T9SS type A sorting domain-containing protein [uncultured Lutibacter sp.]|uniref:T9SS type A sorting domain-containing protein n=1 Tax=uncultured Lutibacter sp. TaxID=437739 RepID=UPI002625B3A9|nr:T9SS type A sorting domain-containing protein [uncultured Lutibacter sp.]
MKKLLLISFLFIFTISFAQQKENTNNVIKNSKSTSTLISVSAYPNPFTSRTNINFVSSKSQSIEFSIKNLVGKTVYLEKFEARPGRNSVLFNRNDLPNGMYIYSLQSGSENISKRLVIR